MKVRSRGKNTLSLKAENAADRRELERIKQELTPPPPFAWFRGKVNVELLKQFIALDRSGKLGY